MMALDTIRRSRLRLLLGALLSLMLAFPYAETGPLDSHLFTLLSSVVLLIGLCCVTDTAWHRSVGLTLVVPAIASDWVAIGRELPALYPIGMAFEAAFLGWVAAVVFGAVFRAREVSADHLAGSVCVYLLVGVACASLYTAIEASHPGAFHIPGAEAPTALWSEMVFFSFTALTTVGYGDITPAVSATRSLATLETVFGVLYMAILVARLVSLYESGREARPA